MVAHLSIMNDKGQNESMNETGEDDENMMEVDGPSDTNTTNTEPELEPYDDEEENNLGNIEKIRELYMRGTVTSANDSTEAVDTVIIFETMEPVDIANINGSPNSDEHSDFMSLCSRVIDECLASDDFHPILHLSQDQLLIDWLTSRHLLTKNDSDE